MSRFNADGFALPCVAATRDKRDAIRRFFHPSLDLRGGCTTKRRHTCPTQKGRKTRSGSLPLYYTLRDYLLLPVRFGCSLPTVIVIFTPSFDTAVLLYRSSFHTGDIVCQRSEKRRRLRSTPTPPERLGEQSLYSTRILEFAPPELSPWQNTDRHSTCLLSCPLQPAQPISSVELIHPRAITEHARFRPPPPKSSFRGQTAQLFGLVWLSAASLSSSPLSPPLSPWPSSFSFLLPASYSSAVQP